jgi:ribonuclease HI
MAKPKNKYYVVWRGRLTGIFESWEECKQQIDAYEGAQYKGYATREEAEAAHKLGYWQALKQAGDNKEQRIGGLKAEILLPSMSVDAACSGNPGVMEYRGVDTSNGREIFRMGPYPDGTNNVGEYLALIHALAMFDKKGDTTTPIYSDSRTAISWIGKGGHRSTLARTTKNGKIFELLARADKWLLAHYPVKNPILKWDTDKWGEIPADFGRK